MLIDQFHALLKITKGWLFSTIQQKNTQSSKVCPCNMGEKFLSTLTKISHNIMQFFVVMFHGPLFSATIFWDNKDLTL